MGIPVLTTPEIADSFVKTLAWLQENEPTLKPLDSYKKIDYNIWLIIDSSPIIVPSSVTILAEEYFLIFSNIGEIDFL